jgi:hypothetical protein
VNDILSELHGRVGERVRAELVRNGASDALRDPAIFAEVDAVLRAAIDRSKPSALLLPELLGDPASWRLETALKYQSHRGGAGGAIIFVKRRILMPVLRWFHEFNRDNFERQRHVNQVLFACVQELAIETARLRRDLEAARGPSASPVATPTHRP